LRLRTRDTAHDLPSQPSLFRPENWLLAALPGTVLAPLAAHLERVTLDRSQVILRAHEPPTAVWWPLSAVVSFVIRVEAGQTVEVGLVGRDGLVAPAGFPSIPANNCDAVVQIAGTALRLDIAVFKRELVASAPLLLAVERFSHLLLVRSMQMSACHLFHSVEQRCVRWLLTVNDLMRDNEIPLTHELLASVLGVHRPTVSQTLGTLARAGLIAEERGRIRIADRRRLEASCCECYQALRQEQNRLLGY
jgi:CRP-like cAMP-binding protein